jgi:hypothetical protein
MVLKVIKFIFLGLVEKCRPWNAQHTFKENNNKINNDK